MLYPLLLEPIYKEKVWGGRSFERFDRNLPGGDDVLFGESWELADLATTAPSGGGGAEARSRILNGPLMKRTLRDVMEHFGALVTGDLPVEPDGGFPLLLKYLDARENLSVQVHPTPEYAAGKPGAFIKSEAWYVVAAEAGSVIYKGFQAGVTLSDVQAGVEEGTIVDLLRAIPANVGDCHYLPSGTCHALGAGVMVAEVQTPSDTTYRIFDWSRTDRELHIEDALACMHFGPLDTGMYEPGSVHEEPGIRRRDLVDCEHFRFCEWSMEDGSSHSFRFERATMLMVVRGRGSIGWGSEDRTLRVGAGQTVLLPAALAEATLRADGGVTALEIKLAKPSPQPRNP